MKMRYSTSPLKVGLSPTHTPARMTTHLIVCCLPYLAPWTPCLFEAFSWFIIYISATFHQRETELFVGAEIKSTQQSNIIWKHIVLFLRLRGFVQEQGANNRQKNITALKNKASQTLIQFSFSWFGGVWRQNLYEVVQWLLWWRLHVLPVPVRALCVFSNFCPDINIRLTGNSEAPKGVNVSMWCSLSLWVSSVIDCQPVLGVLAYVSGDWLQAPVALHG